MRKLVLSLGFILFTTITFSQGLFKPGYIITNENDTVYGDIRYEFFRLTGLKPIIKFKDSSGIIIKYRPNEIKGYSTENGKSCISMSTSAGIGYAEIKVDGPVRLLYLSIFLYNTPNGAVFEETCYLKKEKESYFQIPKIGFKHEVSKYFEDYNELSELISNKKLKFRDREQIVKKYNNWYQKNLLNL